MGLIFNGTEIEKVIYNGTTVEKLIYNGTLVWEAFPAYTEFYFEGDSLTGLQLTFHKNNTEPTEVYMNNTLLATFTDNLNPTLTFDVPVAENSLRIKGGSFYMTDSAIIGDVQNRLKLVTLGKNYVGTLGSAFANTTINTLKCGPNCQVSRGICNGCSSLYNLYIYNPTPTEKATAAEHSYVYGANSNVKIHLLHDLDVMEIAKQNYGDYFNYITDTTQATVLFDL